MTGDPFFAAFLKTCSSTIPITKGRQVTVREAPSNRAGHEFSLGPFLQEVIQKRQRFCLTSDSFSQKTSG